MKKLLLYLTVLQLAVLTASAQPKQQTVYTIDIDNFWKAYDSARRTNDTLQQQQIIQTLYIDKGTRGLRAFMEARNYTAAGWVNLINKYPKFWNSVRKNTLGVKQYEDQIENSISKLKELYPALKPATMYFTIGGLRSGGTTTEDMVLVGAEIATGNASTVVYEFKDRWLSEVFRLQQPNNIVPLNIHEYVHTQQIGEANNLLGQAIKEGACDFI